MRKFAYLLRTTMEPFSSIFHKCLKYSNLHKDSTSFYLGASFEKKYLTLSTLKAIISCCEDVKILVVVNIGILAGEDPLCLYVLYVWMSCTYSPGKVEIYA